MKKTNYLLLVPIWPFRPGIPKIVHQTYKDWESVPEEIKDNIARMKRENPEWDFRFYSHEDSIRFVKEYYDKRTLTYFLRLCEEYGPARADLFRYLAVYAQGGVYIDLKSTITRPLDEVLRADDCYILSHWRNQRGHKEEGAGILPSLTHIPGGEYQQWHVIACKGHPYLRYVIANVLSNIDRYDPERNGVGKVGVLIATGPIPYTLTIHPMKDHFPHRVVQISEDLGIEYSVYDRMLGAQKLTMAHQATLTGFVKHYSQLKTPVVRSEQDALDEIARRFPKLR